MNMDMNRLIKIVYVDDAETKVLKGFLTDEDEFTLSIKLEGNNKPVIIGKRALIKVTYVDEDKHGQ